MKIATNQERLNQLFDSDSRNDTAIADALGVSKQTVSMWRHGTRSPKKSMLIQIAKLYNVSIEWLMGFDVERNANTVAIVIPDSELFKKVLLYMPDDDYAMVMEAFLRTEKIMKERGIPLHD